MLACGRPVTAKEGDFVLRDFRFRSGETLPELRLHYMTFGQPARTGASNAILILHGTGGSGRQFLSPQFAGVLFGPGAALDTTRCFVILPDGIGHGRSSKPSDGLRMRFPRYDYDDMVSAQYRLLTEHLGLPHVRLVMGTSMGGMQTFVWGETYPDFMDALLPLACLPVEIAGRNRLWRRMTMDAIRADPDWKGGAYTTQPQAGLRTAVDLLLVAGSAPLFLQANYGSRDSADAYLDRTFKARLPALDANDLLYQIDASRNYDPWAKLDAIVAPLTLVNSSDDFINPPELGIAERAISKVKRGRFIMIRASEQTRGHGTHTWAMHWQQHLLQLLATAPAKPVTAPAKPTPTSR
jgi:homoserine O-acetyltransferase